ncbi:hypothetical protein L484_003221 [Morus notabilis]|uniref:Transmembrane protein n=1 Tax=Morus notabilis TaxID=981085 RepID=W9QR27_9ROSA|nr:hypothetical protein L484_003221 [Morus notabilis]
MGYCACRRRESPQLYPVLLFLLVVALLMALPTIEVKTPTLDINWPLLVVPLLLLAMVHCLSSVEPSRGPCPIPPPPPVWCHCRGKHACKCGRFKYPVP